MDTTKLTKLFAQYVTLNVLPVPLMKLVLLVLNTESMPHPVHVNSVCSKTLTEFVNLAHTNVLDVLPALETVKTVLKTESTPQPVTVHPDSGMMVTPPNVVNVTVLVPPVNLTPTIV